MARLPRVIQKIFAKNSGANDVIEFGTADSTPNATKDISVIQSSDYESGWTEATLGGDRIPTYQDFNAIGKVATEQLAYIFQEGIPEYDASTTYYQGGLVKRGGTSEIYVTRTDDNTGNALTTGGINADWQYVGNAETLFAGDTAYVEASGSAADAYVVERPEIGGVPVSGPPLQYFTGMQVEFFATASNTGASTIDVEGLGAKSIVQDDGSALTAGFIQANSVVRLYYDGTNFILSEINPFDQSLNTTDSPTFNSLTSTAINTGTVDTGQGANELYPMNQGVRTTDNPQFKFLTAQGTLTPPTLAGIDRFRVIGDTGESAGIVIIAGNSKQSFLFLGDQDDRDVMRFLFNHATGEMRYQNVQSGGYHRFTEETRFDDGVSFDGGTHVLSDYDFDDFTPTLFGGTTAGSPTYTAQEAHYERFGDTVHIWGRVIWTDLGGMGGEARIGNLPFTIKSGQQYRATMTAAYWNGLDLVDNGASLSGYGVPGTNEILLLQGIGDSKNNVINSGVTVPRLTDEGEIYFNMTYKAA